MNIADMARMGAIIMDSVQFRNYSRGQCGSYKEMIREIRE